MHTLHFLDLVRHQLVEDMVGSFVGLLGDYTSLLKQVYLNISTGELTSWAEVNTDELTL